MKEFQNAKQFTIVVADDDQYITELIILYLQKAGFVALPAYDGREAISIVETKNTHLLILDIMLPGMDGWEICESIRKTSNLPIIMLTARGESEDKLHGFGLGADDYVVKPFDPNELVARVFSLLRRTYTNTRQPPPAGTVQWDTLKIDTAGHTVTIEDEYVDLTPREYQLLLTFVQHPNQVLDRQQLLDLVWGEDYEGEDRVVDVFVKRLRQKLSDDHTSWSIETVRGAGYKFKVEA